MNIPEIFFLYFFVVEFYALDIKKVFERENIERNISRRVSGKYPSILDSIPLFIRNTRAKIGLPSQVSYKIPRIKIRTEINIANLIKEEEKPSEHEDDKKKSDSIAFVHR